MKRIKLLLLTTALLLTCNTAFAAISVKFFVGDATIKTLGSEGWDKVKMNQQVQNGDTIKTGEKAYVELDMNGNTMKINEQSKVALGQDYDEEKKVNSLDVDYGNLQLKMNKLKKSGKGFKVNSVSSVCAVRGTEFTVLTGYDGTTILQVQEGKVALSGKEQTVTVGANQESTVPLGGDPTEVKEIKFKEWKEWLSTSKSNMKGKELDILKECLLKIQGLEADIIKLEQLREGNLAEKEKYDKLAKEAKAAGNNDLFKENAAKAFKAAQYAHLSLFKTYLKSSKMDLVKGLTERTYASISDDEKNSEVKQTYNEIQAKYGKYYEKYIKETIESRRKREQRKKNKNK